MQTESENKPMFSGRSVELPSQQYDRYAECAELFHYATQTFGKQFEIDPGEYQTVYFTDGYNISTDVYKVDENKQSIEPLNYYVTDATRSGSQEPALINFRIAPQKQAIEYKVLHPGEKTVQFFASQDGKFGLSAEQQQELIRAGQVDAKTRMETIAKILNSAKDQPPGIQLPLQHNWMGDLSPQGTKALLIVQQLVEPGKEVKGQTMTMSKAEDGAITIKAPSPGTAIYYSIDAHGNRPPHPQQAPTEIVKSVAEKFKILPQRVAAKQARAESKRDFGELFD